jgi:enterochelin esterase-like enzyme
VQGWDWFVGLSIVHGPLHDILLAAAGLGLVCLLSLGRTRRWWSRAVPVCFAVTAVLLALVWVALEVGRTWPDPLPWTVYAWIGAGLLGVVLLAAGWRLLRWPLRVVAIGAAVLVVIGAADLVDSVYGSYPTIATALRLPPPDSVDASHVLGNRGHTQALAPPGRPLWRTWVPPRDLPTHGAVTEVTIPPARSGFRARTAWVYLPPAYLVAARPLLPVLMMIGGQPGGSRDWLDGGRIAQRMDDWAHAHGGLAPVVVMPDGTGGELDNPLCMDSALGRVDTYLSQDVLHWVDTTLQVDPDHARWAVGGFSYGGTCALQLAVAHPDVFPTFFDVSGEQGPSLGNREKTLEAAFHGDAAAFAAVDPLQELAHNRYPASAGYLAVGAQDGVYRPQALAVVAATRAAGMTVIYQELPGGHSWDVWGPAFNDALPWLASRTGIAP